jgi:hypothetical protein
VRKRVVPRRWHVRPLPFLVLAATFFNFLSIAQGQGAKQTGEEASISDPDADHVRERNEWFYRGRVVRGLPSAELRRRAYQAKLQLRAQRATALPHANPAVSFSVGSWVPFGPVPLASDASGNGTQDYHQVAGRATAVVIDPADSTGNTVYIGGAQSGIWKSTNAANAVANNVDWTPITDNQATSSIGAIAIQPGNNDPAKSLILAATGEANNSGDSYFGLGILRSADGGNNWTLISTANSGTLSSRVWAEPAWLSAPPMVRRARRWRLWAQVRKAWWMGPLQARRDEGSIRLLMPDRAGRMTRYPIREERPTPHPRLQWSITTARASFSQPSAITDAIRRRTALPGLGLRASPAGRC